jgi:hypothetical protein
MVSPNLQHGNLQCDTVVHSLLEVCSTARHAARTAGCSGQSGWCLPPCGTVAFEQQFSRLTGYGY